MRRGFHDVMRAQFFASIADNALFVATVALLRQNGAPDWQQAALVSVFAFFYVVLAPVAGALADRFPKGRVMLASNTMKIVGCGLMLFTPFPLLAYSVVGLGAACYGPAKYGIVTEMLPPSQLVKANGWIEGLTVISIILGLALGGALVGTKATLWLLDVGAFAHGSQITSLPKIAMVFVVGLYGLAALFNLRINATGVAMQPMPALNYLLRDFYYCNKTLWRDGLGQISLATTTLFWGVGGPLRYLVIAWGAVAFGLGISDATLLMGIVALGTAAGVLLASHKTTLVNATDVLPLGVAPGLIMIALVWVSSVWVALPFLFALGCIGGFMVVPMNALLQHRGAVLMSSGRSIAVQNLNEQLGILAFGTFSSALTASGMSVLVVLAMLGSVVAVCMALIFYKHRLNQLTSQTQSVEPPRLPSLLNAPHPEKQ